MKWLNNLTWLKAKLWFKRRYRQVINSIAFYPAIIAVLFLFLAVATIALDFSSQGQHFKSQMEWLKLRDASTARTIISSIVAGIISLTVFSFTMVMIILNQTASQMSNRILDNLIGSRFQQIALGIYVGTIVYALFLLTSVRDVDSGLRIPAISTYLLIFITVFDIFLFIYFLHYITQSVKYNVIIRKIYLETKDALEATCSLKKEPEAYDTFEDDFLIYSPVSGVYEDIDVRTLIHVCEENNCVVQLINTPGTFVLKGLPVVSVNKILPAPVANEIAGAINIHFTESIKANYLHGLRQLSEVAIKALSPGINDPGTAIESLRALFELYAYRVAHFPENEITDSKKRVCIITKHLSFDKIFENTLLPVWDYGKKDRMVAGEMRHLLIMLLSISRNHTVARLLQDVEVQWVIMQ